MIYGVLLRRPLRFTLYDGRRLTDEEVLSIAVAPLLRHGRDKLRLAFSLMIVPCNQTAAPALEFMLSYISFSTSKCRVDSRSISYRCTLALNRPKYSMVQRSSRWLHLTPDPTNKTSCTLLAMWTRIKHAKPKTAHY